MTESPNMPDAVESLRSRALDASPAMAVDQARVLSRGRRARLTRTLGGTVSALAVAGLAAFTVTQFWGGHTTPPPAEHSAPLVLPDPVPTWVAEHNETPIVRQLAPGILAEVKPALWRLTDGTMMAVTGMGDSNRVPSMGDSNREPSWIGIVPASAAELDSAFANLPAELPKQPPWSGDSAVFIKSVLGDDARFSSSSALGWPSGTEDLFSLYDLGDHPSMRSVTYGSGGSSDGLTDPRRSHAMVVPEALADASLEICLMSVAQPQLPGDRFFCVSDVPMFRAPTAQGRLMFLVSMDPVPTTGHVPWIVGAIFTMKDGTAVPFGVCEGDGLDIATRTLPSVRDVCLPGWTPPPETPTSQPTN